MAEWLPIENAPRDGTRILAWSPDWMHVVIAWWRENPRVRRSWFTITDEYDDYDLEDEQPTHWQPLPEPPK